MLETNVRLTVGHWSGDGMVNGDAFQVFSIIFNKLSFNKRSASLQDVSDDEIAYAIITSIASQLNWANNNLIEWFAYTSNTITDHSLSIQLLLMADKVKLGLIPD